MKDIENLDKIISRNLKYEIEHSGRSKSDIARAIGVSTPTISQYCSGRIQPSLSTLSRLCRYLDCSADDILFINSKCGLDDNSNDK